MYTVSIWQHILILYYNIFEDFRGTVCSIYGIKKSINQLNYQFNKKRKANCLNLLYIFGNDILYVCVYILLQWTRTPSNNKVSLDQHNQLWAVHKDCCLITGMGCNEATGIFWLVSWHTWQVFNYTPQCVQLPHLAFSGRQRSVPMSVPAPNLEPADAFMPKIRTGRERKNWFPMGTE